MFLGVSCATDYLSTILYVHSTSILSARRSKRSANTLLMLEYPVMFSLGILTTLTNIAAAYLVAHPYLSIQLAVILVPIIEGILQFAVLIYVLRHVSIVTFQLKKARLDFKAKDAPDWRMPVSLQLQVRLEKQMRFWVKVSAFGTGLTLLCTLLIYGILTSPLIYRIICGLGTVGKQVNVLGQLMISKPAALHKNSVIKVLYQKSLHLEATPTRSHAFFSSRIQPS